MIKVNNVILDSDKYHENMRKCVLVKGYFRLYSQGKPLCFLFFLSFPENIFYFIALEREQGRERNINVKEKHGLVASHMCPDWGSHSQDWGMNLQPRMCLDWELNLQPFGYRTILQTPGPCSPGLCPFLSYDSLDASYARPGLRDCLP